MKDVEQNNSTIEKPRLRWMLRVAIYLGYTAVVSIILMSLASYLNDNFILDPVTGPHPFIGVLAKILGTIGFYSAGISFLFAFLSLVLSPFSKPRVLHAVVSLGTLIVMWICGSVWAHVMNEARISTARFPARDMTQLGAVLKKYSQQHDGQLPEVSRWCDVLIESEAVKPHDFILEGTQDSSYALNENLRDLRLEDVSKDTVLMFETMQAKNPAGGKELINTEFHDGKGCVILFADMHVEFVKTDDFNDLRWQP
jgi:hypothetical protein